MNHSDSTEMDRLLRRHARRNSRSLRAGLEKAADALETNAGAHMDADELNAYAEGALPETARSRYFAHLADCDSCRRIVTELTLAAVAANEAKARVGAASTPPSKSWRERLAAIFSPPVLRYGVPALALFTVIVVAFVALRTQREQPSFVAQKEEARRSSTQSAAANSNLSAEAGANTAESHAVGNATSNTAAIGGEMGKTEPPVPAATSPAVAQASPSDQSPPPPAPQQPVADTPAVAKSATANTGAREGVEDNKRAQEVVTVTAPEAGPTAASAPAAARKRRDNEEQPKAAKEKDEAASNTGTAGGLVPNRPAADQDKVARGKASGRSAQSLPATKAPASQSEVRKEDAENILSVETRSVGGRSFRRRGGAWVDTAYNSSYTTISVRRGSEQYRALVADEPGLRSITRQLGGEVIVVWGKKAYRFY